jgi:hypothetical protein
MEIMTNKTPSFAIIFAIALASCSSSPEKQVAQEPKIRVNDFPTRDRVEYVLECVAKNGGLNFTNQNSCTCMVDKIAEKMTYKEYIEARTFTFMRSTPGEKGGLFRDPKQAKDLRKLLKESEQYAESKCFVR